MKITCKCNQPIEIDSGLAGQTFNCPSCNELLMVPNVPPVIIQPIPQKTVVPVIRNPHICLDCEQIGTPKTITKGSFVMEVVLWLMFIFPGLLYSLWRLTTRKEGCSSCGSSSIIHINTPKGKRLIASLGR